MDAQRGKQKSYVYLIVVALALGVYALNTYMRGVWEREEGARKASVQAREQAEMQARLEAEGRVPKSVFEMPADSGPPQAPVKIVAYINSANDCLEMTAKLLTEVQEVYGEAVSIDYRDTVEPEIQAEADKKQIGCDAGIYFNGEMTRKAQPGNITGLRQFLGAADTDHYRSADVYGAINYLLEDKGVEVPAEARKLASLEDK